MLFLLKNFSRKNSGQSLTEVAIALPLLFIILLGMIDLGRMYYTYVALANSAREAARYGASQQCGTADTAIRNKAKAEATSAGFSLSDSDIQISYPDGACANGNAIQITTQTNFSLITAVVLGGAAIPLRATTQFQLYYGSGS